MAVGHRCCKATSTIPYDVAKLNSLVDDGRNHDIHHHTDVQHLQCQSEGTWFLLHRSLEPCIQQPFNGWWDVIVGTPAEFDVLCSSLCCIGHTLRSIGL